MVEYGNLDQLAMLIHIDGGRFARGTDHDNGIGLFLDMEIHQISEGIEIQPSIGMHRGNNGNNRTGDHRRTILENGKTEKRAMLHRKLATNPDILAEVQISASARKCAVTLRANADIT